MRWSRQQEPTSFGELMESSDEDTQVRLYPGDHTADPTAPTTPPPAEAAAGTDDGFLDDEDYLPQERRGPGRVTVALVAALVLAVGVLGGVWVEKQLGSSQSSAAAGQRFPGGAAGGQGLPGGAAGGQGLPGGTASGAAGAPGGSASEGAGTGSGTAGGAAGSTGSSTTPVVVGTVASTTAKALVVTDLGGTRHTVTVAATTTVTTPYDHGALKSGDTVAVSGSTASDGSVTATGITVS